ncbi:MAG: methylmalonyl-CoA mutase family protein [Mesorhizobium sp.]
MDAGAVFRSAVFPPFDEARWRALAGKALTGADLETALSSRTDDGILIEALSPRVKDPHPAGRVSAGGRIIVTQRIDDPDPARANRQAREDVAQGASGLSLVFAGAPNAFGYGLPPTAEAMDAVLEGIPIDQTYLRIDAHPLSRVTVDWLVGLIGRRRVDPARLSLSFGIDPAAVFAGTGRLRMSIEALQASMPQSLAHFFALGVPGVLLEADGRVFHNAGATEAEELGIVLASAVSHLRMFEEARQALIYAAPHIGFALAVDQDQFLSMAKLRAMRRLWARAQEACSIMPSAANVHAETSYRMMTARDPETNILRAAVAAFAAATGGADSLAILPYTAAHGLPDAAARRLARNTLLVMAGESRIDHVVDPAAGAGSLEELTDRLCEAAWSVFQEIEKEGGVLKSLAAGKLQGRIRTARETRAEAYRAGKKTLIGTTLYPLAAERPVATLPASQPALADEGVASCEPLPAVRIDQALEGRG